MIAIKCSVENVLEKRTDPVDTGRKLNVHKTFRKHPGRLLNDLRTFNLRPVSIGDYPIFKRSRSEVFCKKGVLRNFAKFTGKDLHQIPFFNKV